MVSLDGLRALYTILSRGKRPRRTLQTSDGGLCALFITDAAFEILEIILVGQEHLDQVDRAEPVGGGTTKGALCCGGSIFLLLLLVATFLLGERRDLGEGRRTEGLSLPSRAVGWLLLLLICLHGRLTGLLTTLLLRLRRQPLATIGGLSLRLVLFASLLRLSSFC